MRGLLRVFASILSSWLRPFRREPRQPKPAVGNSATGTAPHHTGVGAPPTKTKQPADRQAARSTGATAPPTIPRTDDILQEPARQHRSERSCGVHDQNPGSNAPVLPVEPQPPAAHPGTTQAPSEAPECTTRDGLPSVALRPAPERPSADRKTSTQVTTPRTPSAGVPDLHSKPPQAAELATPRGDPRQGDHPAESASRADSLLVAQPTEGDSVNSENDLTVTDPYWEPDPSAKEPEATNGAGAPTPVPFPTETRGDDPNHQSDAPPADSKDAPGQAAATGEDASAPDPTAPSHRPTHASAVTPAARRSPPQYRPPAGAPPAHPRPLAPSGPSQHARQPATQRPPAQIEVRILFQRGGRCSVSLLPRRLPGLPDELTVLAEGADVELLAFQDDWYQDVAPDDLADLLKKGTIWRDSDTGQEWTLSGRRVFVLAHGTTHRGFISRPRLTLGRNHVVLCTATTLGPIADALREAGCDDWTQLGEEDGAPRGWLVLTEVVPQRPVAASGHFEILNVLRPLPEIEIALEGGIRLAYNTWLLGYPPAIRVYGNPEHTATVLLDGQQTTLVSRDQYTAPGWDIAGDHLVSCSGTNRRYSLARCAATWAYWPAHTLDVSNSPRYVQKFAFCGPLVRPVTTHGRRNAGPVFQIPAANPVLLGARPGEVFVARPRVDIRGAACLATPPFDPVWAIPLQPLQCDKRVNRILLLRALPPTDPGFDPPPVGFPNNLDQWCLSILDASRKRLALQPSRSHATDLWREYRRLARRLWRNLR